MYKLLIVFVLIFGVFFRAEAKGTKKPVSGQPSALRVLKIPVVDSFRMDTTAKLNLQNFNTDSLNKYRNNPDFQYDDNTKKAGLSWWERLWLWFWTLIEKLFNSGSSAMPSLPFMKYVIWALALGLLIFMIVKMAGLNIANIFNRMPKNIQVPYSESLENIHQITFEEEIEKALNQHNYRLAIRLLYLSTLKQLNDRQLIEWQLEKTNSAYLIELKDANQKQTFGILTRQFEYVWYGDFPVDAQLYQNINTLFHDFKLMLK
ncbi:DUF4129 domain-containing protein [Mucilaginibacter sp.]